MFHFTRNHSKSKTNAVWYDLPYNNHHQRTGDQRRRFDTVNLDNYIIAEQPAARLFFNRIDQCMPRAYFGTGANGVQETHFVIAIVDAHHRAFQAQCNARRHGREQREGQQTMRDGAAKWRVLRFFFVNMDELVIFGAVGKFVDAVLTGFKPVGHAHFLAFPAFQFTWHNRWHIISPKYVVGVYQPFMTSCIRRKNLPPCPPPLAYSCMPVSSRICSIFSAIASALRFSTGSQMPSVSRIFA